MTVGSKQRLTITRWDETSQSADTSQSFVATLNPAGYSLTDSIKYTQPLPLQPKKLDTVLSQSLSLEELVIDGTGVVSPPPGGVAQDVNTQLDNLRKTVFTPLTSDSVDYPVVQLVWGSLYFIGRLTSMSVKYTLFKPTGEPLRARVSLAFIEHEDNKSQTGGFSSTSSFVQQIQPTMGASLPLICFTAYTDPALALGVALSNGLTSFRNATLSQGLTLPVLVS